MIDQSQGKISIIEQIGQRLKKARKILGVNQREFAAKIGMSHGMISMVETGKAELSQQALLLIEYAWGISKRYLEKDEGEVLIFRHRAIELPELQLVDPKESWFKGPLHQIRVYWPVPIMEGTAAAGPPGTVFDNEVEDWIPTIYHQKWSPNPTKTVAVRIYGDSMEPTIPDGGLVAIDFVQRDPQSLKNKIVAFRIDGGVTIKRLFLTEKKQWIARPDNPSSAEIYIFEDEEIRDAIIGKVVWWWGKQ